MSTTDYVIGAILVLIVLRQIRWRRQTVANLIYPLVLVGAAAAYYLKSIPTQGNDTTLYLALAALGAVLGVGGALATHMRRDQDGCPMSRAGWLAAAIWVVAMGSRMAFAYAATNGWGPTVVSFSIAHRITGAAAWTAALLMMAVAQVAIRIVFLRMRGRLLPAVSAEAGAAVSTSA